MQCSLCEIQSKEESEIHLLECSKIMSSIGQDIDLANANYSDIFSENIDNQITITQVFEKIIKIKKIHLKNKYL